MREILLFYFWPFINQVESAREIVDLNQELFDAGNKIALYWFGPVRPVIAVGHPDTIKVILKSQEPKAGGGNGYDLLKPWLGEGLLISKGKKWERNRRLLTSAFHFEILQPYITIYNSVTDILMEKLEKECKNGEFVEVFTPVSLATLDTMLQCAFSYQGNIQILGNHPYVSSVNRVSKLLIERSITPLHLITLIYKMTAKGKEFFKLCDYMHKFAEGVIETRKKDLEKESSQEELKKKRHLDFLDILLTARDENNQPLSDFEIRDEVDTFLFEGHDTTASAISWCLYGLAKYPELQQKVYQDVKSVMGDSTDVKWKHLSEFQYLPIFIKECLRYFSPVPAVSRQLEKPMMLDGVEIPKHTVIDIMIINLHHNIHVYDNPSKFDPERFRSSVLDGKDPYAFVPFAAGPRNCIGQNFAMNEIKTVISKIVHRFHIEYDKDRIPELLPELVSRAKYGLYLKFTPRQ
ncbi:hypothetical protein LOTGIDRAFT_122078 [Lottia gigantea]|uniref:Uncharacterized protein n=1 Tax=Lottia gigantea TaxID=225164 RepID=V3ZJW5_LOTGI|nr:hypothetical protein LOTGIDRAFT_122078 [Lottia gigantea]ESO91583.1 hypothetical protein LOTGIDRAFT_122078 [Lottia gigantea]